ncbi:MAG: VOC family protein [Bacteroidota bacterium]
MANAINWFEIPTNDFSRAKDFYAQVFQGEFHIQEMGGIKMGFFPNDGEGVNGAICHGEGYEPSTKGALIYLNGGNDLAEPLARVEAAGGTIEMPKTKISDEIGFMAIFHDSEGNRLAFHSPS